VDRVKNTPSTILYLSTCKRLNDFAGPTVSYAAIVRHAAFAAAGAPVVVSRIAIASRAESTHPHGTMRTRGHCSVRRNHPKYYGMFYILSLFAASNVCVIL